MIQTATRYLQDWRYCQLRSGNLCLKTLKNHISRTANASFWSSCYLFFLYKIKFRHYLFIANLPVIFFGSNCCDTLWPYNISSDFQSSHRLFPRKLLKKYFKYKSSNLNCGNVGLMKIGSPVSNQESTRSAAKVWYLTMNETGTVQIWFTVKPQISHSAGHQMICLDMSHPNVRFGTMQCNGIPYTTLWPLL